MAFFIRSKGLKSSKNDVYGVRKVDQLPTKGRFKEWGILKIQKV